MPAVIVAPSLVEAPAPPAPKLPLATVDDLPWCTCTVPLDGTVPHRVWCDLRNGANW